MSMLGGYTASLGGSPAGGGTMASQQDTPHTQNQNVTANAGGDKRALHYAIAVVIAGLVVLLIGRGYLRNAKIA